MAIVPSPPATPSQTDPRHSAAKMRREYRLLPPFGIFRTPFRRKANVQEQSRRSRQEDAEAGKGHRDPGVSAVETDGHKHDARDGNSPGAFKKPFAKTMHMSFPPFS